MDQSQQRATILSRRRALDQDSRSRRSLEVSERLKSAWRREGMRAGLNIGVYRSMPDEVDLEPLLAWLEEAGNRLYFPKIKNEPECLIEWACVPRADGALWRANRFGILEPCDGIETHVTPPLDVIFVPGVVFGEAGQRVGMGKGFYDRLLKNLPDALRVSMAYDFQIVPETVENPWDQRVHWIFSETREVRACGAPDRIGQLIE